MKVLEPQVLQRQVVTGGAMMRPCSMQAGHLSKEKLAEHLIQDNTLPYM